MALFNRETCGICDKEIKQTKHRVENGFVCDECAKLLSPFSRDLKRLTIDDIRNQIAYRMANEKDVARFNATQAFGTGVKLYIDEDAKKIVVSSSDDWKHDNPDVVSCSQITECDIEVEESRTETRNAKQHVGRSSEHAGWDVSYNIYIALRIDSPWIDEIEFKTHNKRIGNRDSAEYAQAEQTAISIRKALGFADAQDA